MIDGANFNGDLRPHQRTGLAFLLDHPNALLADDVGLGKTPTALAYIGRLAERGELDRRGQSVCRVLWVTDNNLLAQTKAEVERFLPTFTVATSECREYATLHGRTASIRAHDRWRERFGPGPDILVIGYQHMASRRHWLERMAKPGLIVLDEVNSVGGGGRTFNMAREVTGWAPRVLGITATVVENNALELHRILSVLRVPDLIPRGTWERQFVAWRDMWISASWREARPDGWASEEAAEKVRAFLTTCMTRHTEQDAGLVLPHRVGDEYRFVTLSPAQIERYEAEAATIGQAAVRRMETASRLLGHESALVDQLAVELERIGDAPTVVYSESVPMLHLAREAIAGRGITVVHMEGATSHRDREAAVGALWDGRARVLLGTEVLERGLNLHVSRNLISLDSSWNPARERQREGRVRRIGSQHDTYEHLTILPDTPLTRGKLGRLDRKRDTANAIGLGVASD